MNTVKRIWTMILVLGLAVSLAGCAKEKQLTLVSNDLYADPKNPTQEQIAAFNDLSAAIQQGTEVELVKAVAISFAFDFYSFKNKDNEDDIGGLSYFPPKKINETKNYVSFYYYKNYQPIVNQYGADSLPQVKQVVAVDPVATMYADKELKNLNAYSVRLALQYEDTKIPETALKMDTVITLVKYDGAWRVVAIE